MVVMRPASTPKASSRTFTMGTKQLVVHDAFEMTKSFVASKVSSLTPMTKVASASPEGAEMMTRFAPAARCALAASRVVKRPDDSTTTSMPSSPHGRSAGLRSAKTLMAKEPTRSSSSLTLTFWSRTPWVESYFKRCAFVAGGITSFNATISTSGFASAARKKPRPIRPNPLIATRVTTGVSLIVGLLSSHFFENRQSQFLHIVREARHRRDVADVGRHRARVTGEAGALVDEHEVDRNTVTFECVDVVLEGESLGLGDLGVQVRHVDLLRLRSREGLGDPRHHAGGEDTREE